MTRTIERNLYEGEEILETAKFSKIPLIILWSIVLIIDIICIIVGSVESAGAAIICIEVFAFIIGAVIYTVLYLNRKLVITNKRVIGKMGFLFLRYLDIPLNKIQSVATMQTFWERVFDYGTIIITNGAIRLIGHYFIGLVNFNTFKTILMCIIDENDFIKYECIKCQLSHKIDSIKESQN